MNQNPDVAVTANSITAATTGELFKLKRLDIFKNYPDHKSLDNLAYHVFDLYYKDWKYKYIIDRGPAGTPSNLSDLATSTSTITDSDWHHYVGVRYSDGSTQCKIYIDGDLDVASNSGSAFNTMTDSDGDLHIGKSPRQTTYSWVGLIDEVKIYNRALSASEITKDYKHQKGKHKN